MEGHTPNPTDGPEHPTPPKGGSGAAPADDLKRLLANYKATLNRPEPSSPTPMIVLHREEDGGAFAVRIGDVNSLFDIEGKTWLEGGGAAPYRLPIKETLSIAVGLYNRAVRAK